MGHHANVSLRYGGAKKGEYTRNLGEVVSFSVPGVHEELEYCAYIASDPYDASINAKERHWKRKWRRAPPASHVKDPVGSLRWHLFRGLWLAKILELNRAAQTDSLSFEGINQDIWRHVVRTLNDYHDRKNTVKSVVRKVEERIMRMTNIEMSSNDVRKGQKGSQSSPGLVKPYVFVPRVVSRPAFDDELMRPLHGDGG